MNRPTRIRLQGKIKTWNDDRGFGFVVQNGGSEKAFLHVSAFDTATKQPAEGDVITFEVERGPKGPRAVNAAFVSRRSESIARPSISYVGLATGFLILCMVSYVLSIRVTHPNSTIKASVYKAIIARSAINADSRFTCQGKNYCSQMTSCAEAFFYLERCGAIEMDGDRDGIPCEQQLCR